MRRGILFSVLAGMFLPAVVLMTVPGCSPPPEEPAALTYSGASDADLVIALLPERNVFEQKAKYTPLQEYLSKKLGITVYFRLVESYGRIFDELEERTVDGGFFGSMNGTVAQLRGAVEILVRPQWIGGSSTYRGYVFTHAHLEGDITEDPRTWQGKKIALVDKVTTAGYLYQLSLLRRAGYTGDLEDYFERVIFTGSHDATIAALLRMEVDLGGCKDTVYDEFMLLHPGAADKLILLSSSTDVPSNALGVRPDLPDFLKQRLKRVLVGMNADPEGEVPLKEFGALRFLETSLDDYEPVTKMAAQAGIDLHELPPQSMKLDRPYR